MAYRNGKFVPNETRREQRKAIANRSVRITRGVTYQRGRPHYDGVSPYMKFYKSGRTIKAHGNRLGTNNLDDYGMPEKIRPNAEASRRKRKEKKAILAAQGITPWRNPKKQAKRLKKNREF